jgi:hypothetical protein
MRRMASIIALLFLISAATPLLACMTGRAMTQQESACCRSMHGDCGAMAAMGCCRTELRTDGHPQLATTPPPTRINWAVVTWLPPSLNAVQSLPSAQRHAAEEHSPPGLLLAKTTILRI